MFTCEEFATTLKAMYTHTQVMPMQKTCKVAVVSTYPPKKCGLASFTAALLPWLRLHPDISSGCEIGIVALSDPSDRLVYMDPFVHYDLRVDSVSAAIAISHLNAYLFCITVRGVQAPLSA